MPLTSIMRDLSQTKSAAGDQPLSEEKFAAAFNASPDAITITAADDGTLVDVNDGFVRLTGFGKDEVIGRTSYELDVWKDPEDRERFVQRLLEEGTVRDFESRFKIKNGSIRIGSVSGSLIGIGNKTCILAIIRDITEAKQLEAQLAQADRLSAMGMLAAGVAHEINNPLTYILFHLESLRDELPALYGPLKSRLDACIEALGTDRAAAVLPQGSRYPDEPALERIIKKVNQILHGAQRVRDIARQLHAFSRVETNDVTAVDICEVIDAALTMAMNEIRHRCRLVRELKPVPAALGNESRLTQVFLNLLINAAHAIDESSSVNNEIRVRTRADDSFVYGIVEDTGKGIASEHLSRLFEPFFSTKVSGKGAGLGLSISAGTVREYGGEIVVESREGKGSTFAVRLPLYQKSGTDKPVYQSNEPNSKAPPPEDLTHHPRHATGRLRRVLIVDDETLVLDVLAAALESDYEVITARDGFEARRLLQGITRYDLILCDLMMPRMSGAELHRWAELNRPDTVHRFVFISAGAFTPQINEFLNKTDATTLEKPLNFDGLAETVRQLIARPKKKSASSGSGDKRGLQPAAPVLLSFQIFEQAAFAELEKPRPNSQC